MKCGRQFCAQCITQIQTYNGNDRSFRCMYCLQEYRKNSFPEENQLLIKQLWNESIIKYAMKHTHELLIKQCIYNDLVIDIDCKRRHLMNLVSLYKRFCGRTQFLHTTENLINQLTELIQHINEKQNDNLDVFKNIYQRLISATIDDNDIGLLYISHCEHLQLEIFEAESCSMFPKTNTKMNEWLHEQGAANEFQPKILDLFKAIEQDLINQRADPYLAARTKIGVIGYTGVGKSSLINCLLGVKSLTEDGAAPISTNKGTYFPLQFDMGEPLVSPDDPKKTTSVTFVDIPGVDKDKYSTTSEVKEDAYLDEIRKADCDIYILVYDEKLRTEQHEWIDYIEKALKRKCVLVTSKIDIYYLAKFQERFGESTNSEQSQFEAAIIEQLQLDNFIESRSVFLVTCDYASKSDNITLLFKDQLFDFPLLLKELGRLAFDACSCRIHALASRTIARVINSRCWICFYYTFWRSTTSLSFA